MASGIKLSYEHVYEYLKNLGFELIDEILENYLNKLESKEVSNLWTLSIVSHQKTNKTYYKKGINFLKKKS